MASRIVTLDVNERQHELIAQLTGERQGESRDPAGRGAVEACDAVWHRHCLAEVLGGPALQQHDRMTRPCPLDHAVAEHVMATLYKRPLAVLPELLARTLTLMGPVIW